MRRIKWRRPSARSIRVKPSRSLPSSLSRRRSTAVSWWRRTISSLTRPLEQSWTIPLPCPKGKLICFYYFTIWNCFFTKRIRFWNIVFVFRYDFFLVSQNVRQGTVSPTNYNVIYDESRVAPDSLQILTNKLCHLYFNWSGTVAVPAPCQYAHKLAYLTGVALSESAPPCLSHRLWYL